jgi:hypothetical protein
MLNLALDFQVDEILSIHQWCSIVTSLSTINMPPRANKMGG